MILPARLLKVLSKGFTPAESVQLLKGTELAGIAGDLHHPDPNPGTGATFARLGCMLGNGDLTSGEKQKRPLRLFTRASVHPSPCLTLAVTQHVSNTAGLFTVNLADLVEHQHGVIAA